jgi:hypothetical protein
MAGGKTVTQQMLTNAEAKMKQRINALKKYTRATIATVGEGDEKVDGGKVGASANSEAGGPPRVGS